MFFRSGKSVKAKKIAGSLIAVFPNATPPLVWKFDLEKNHSFTLTLQGEEGDWELGVTSPRGEFYSVTRFLSRDDAQEAFDHTRCALLKGERKFWGGMGLVGTVLLVILLILFLAVSGMRSMASLALPQQGHMRAPTPTSMASPTFPSEFSPLPTSAPAPTPTSGPAGEIKQGVPLSADQVLTPPP